MAKYTSEICERKIGNKFDMILVAATRVREIRDGSTPKLSGRDGSVIMSLREIEAGLIGRELLEKFERTRFPSSRPRVKRSR